MSTYQSLPTYLCLPAYLFMSTYLPMTTYQSTSTHLPMSIYQYIPTHVNLPSSTDLPQPIVKYQYIIAADPGAGTGLVTVAWQQCPVGNQTEISKEAEDEEVFLLGCSVTRSNHFSTEVVVFEIAQKFARIFGLLL